MQAARFTRTPAGQDEIRTRALALPRPVRNLLLVITAERPIDYWLSQVNGCGADELQMLLDAGLLAPVAAPAPAAPPTPPAPAAAAPAPKPVDASAEIDALRRQVREASYGQLYGALNTHGKETLGLMGGYRFVLDIERAAGPMELQALALRYVDRVAEQHGLVAVRRLAELL